MSIEIPVFNPNSVDPDQTPRSAASDQDLHCLSISIIYAARHKLAGPKKRIVLLVAANSSLTQVLIGLIV